VSTSEPITCSKPHRGLVSRTLGSFLPSRFPPISRRNYRLELAGISLFSLSRAAFDGATIGVIVRIAYDGVVPDQTLNWYVALLSSAPAMANIINFVWAKLSHAQNKVRFLTGLQLGVLALVAMIAAVPDEPIGLTMLTVLIFGAWVCWSGFASVRTTIWRQNYPRHVRARVTGKLGTVQMIVMGTVAAVLGTAMNDGFAGLALRLGMPELAHSLRLETLGISPMDIFRGYVIGAVLVAALGTAFLSRIRVRRQHKLLRDEAGTSTGGAGPSLNPLGMLVVLREDRFFREYMVAQMLLGAGNLMVWPLMPIVLKERFNAGYATGLILNSTLPMIVVPFLIPLWARLLDRVHIVTFRSYHSWVFVAATGLLLVAALMQSMTLLILSVLLKGAGMAGGMLAWQLGHHDFAPPERSSAYMGIHVTLTGVRGIAAPLIGVGLYNLLKHHWPGSESWSFLLCMVLIVGGGISFVRLRMRMNTSTNATRAKGTDGIEPGAGTRGVS